MQALKWLQYIYRFKILHIAYHTSKKKQKRHATYDTIESYCTIQMS